MTSSDQILLLILEGFCGWLLFFICFAIPVHDWWQRRCIRKKFQYERELETKFRKKFRPVSRVEKIKQSRYHSVN